MQNTFHAFLRLAASAKAGKAAKNEFKWILVGLASLPYTSAQLVMNAKDFYKKSQRFNEVILLCASA